MKNSVFMLLAALLSFTACATNPTLPDPAPSELPEPPAPVVSRERIKAPEPEPQIQEPVLTITSIAVMQAELINTRFKVSLRVDNPNSVPLELSAFSYELYGGGRFWADGKETASKEDGAVMRIPPEGFAEMDLLLQMNFMNMKREVLDQIIALKAVKYRFAGDVLVSTGIESLPRFTMRFDRSGESPVMR
jgi:LEA14-like dessication related protein